MVTAPTPATSPLVRLVGHDGIDLSIAEFGSGGSPSVLFAHGFGQTRHAWTGAAVALAAQGMHVVAFDARGHGESGRAAGGEYHMEQFVGDLAFLAGELQSRDGHPPVLVGASMGGLLGLMLAGTAARPPFAALVLVDITPRWETRGVERILGFMRAHPDGFSSYEAAADAIGAYMPQRERKSEASLRPLLRQGDDGRLRWHWDPALLETVSHETERYQPQLFEAARRIKVPMLLLSGGRSDIVSRDTVTEFMGLVPHARHVDLPDATHMVAGDANDAFTGEVAKFINQLN
jgi:pimeloyl-ACP methyl ester carboxylesterase